MITIILWNSNKTFIILIIEHDAILCSAQISFNEFLLSMANFFLPPFQVIGDASPDASKLMKREGVRSVPSFHYFKNGEKVDVVNGANAEAIEAAITKNLEK